MHYCKNLPDAFISSDAPKIHFWLESRHAQLLICSEWVGSCAKRLSTAASERARRRRLGAWGCWGCVCVRVRGWLGGYLLTECLSLPAHLTERRWSPSRRPCRSSWMRQTREPRSSRPRWDAAATWPTISSALFPSNQPCHLSHASPQRSALIIPLLLPRHCNWNPWTD